MAALEMMRQGLSREEVSSRTPFTTHTPVAAGHDRFEWGLVESVVQDLIGPDEKKVATDGNQCSMSHLGIGMAGKVNAVSILNAEVASGMFPRS